MSPPPTEAPSSSRLAPPYRPPECEARREISLTVRTHRSCNIPIRGVASLSITIPLTGGEAITLERQLQALLRLPPFLTVFSIVRSDESMFAPPLPLILLHGIVDVCEDRCDVDAHVRPIIQSRPGATLRPPPPPPLPIAAVASNGAELLRRLRRDGVVRLKADDALASTLRECYAALPAFFQQPREVKARLYCHTGVSERDKRYAGMGEDCGREWLQLRRRGAVGSGCLPEGAPSAFVAGFDGLRVLAASCLRSLASAVGADAAAWLAVSDLADAEEEEAQPPTPDATASSSAAGPTVFRLYRYLPEGVGTGCHAHSDLGLLTLSPAPTRPGLLLYDSETLEWHEGEDGMQAEEITLFCGEQLSYLSSGQLPSPLHRVPPPSSSSSSNATTRYSMPFFARARPEALLTPMAAGAGAPHALPPVRCEDLILKQLFRRRPWRQQKVEGEEGVTPDY